jgi:hypothetical protein
MGTTLESNYYVPMMTKVVTNLSQAATYSDIMINRNRFYFFETTKYKQKP